MLEADVETTGLQSYYHEMFMAQFLGEGEPVWFHTEPGVVHPDVQKWLDSAASLGGIRAWNSKFDLGFFYRAGYKLPDDSLFHDGMVAAHIVDERFSVALKARGEKLFGADERDDEQQVKEWLAAERRERRKVSKETGEEYTPPTYADVPDEIMVPYGVQDVVLQRKVCEVYEQALSTNDQLRDVYELERGVLAALFWAEMRGVPVDQEAAALYEASLLSGMDEAEDSLKRLAGIDTFNPNAPRQVAEALERRGVDLRGVPETPTGQRKMSADVLEAFGDPLASEVLRWKKNSKLLATYLGPLLHGKRDKVWGDSAPYITPDGRIHPNFRQTGAVTGRMSCIAEGELVDAPRDLVKHPDGIPIEEIRPGDMVYSFDAEGQPRPAAVKAVHQQGRKSVVKLVYRRRSGNASLGTLKATPDHRIALEDGTWKRTDELQPGDKLRFLSRTTYRGTAADADTNHEVVCVVDEGQEIMTYDLTIDGAPNFVVNEISVHNCSEPNLQNWHRDDLSLRYLVRAEEGKKLVCCDLDAIEMKLFAAFAGRGVLLDLVKEGDPHAHTAQMVGIGDRIKPDGSVTPARQQGKTFNFALIYGGGVKTVMDTFGVSRSRAREMIDRFHSAYPEIGNFQQRIQAKLYDQGYVVTPWGRRHRVDERKQIHDQAYKFPNKLVQGTAADLLKDALVKIHKDGVPVILTVHDEIIAEVDESDAAEAAHLIEKHMTEHPRIDKVVPLQAEAQIVDRWSDAKTPGFVPTYIQES